MAKIQSDGHFYNTLDRITVAIGSTVDRNLSAQAINAITAGTQFADCTNRTERQLASASALSGRPFLRNDHVEFAMAQFPLPHAAYNIV
jgi:hypothetical protein